MNARGPSNPSPERRWWRRVGTAASGLVVVASLATGVLAAGAGGAATMTEGYPAGDGSGAMFRIWERTERPVLEGITRRTWMWGPDANTTVIEEPYAEAPGGSRMVQYFDKSRMEITNPSADEDSEWYVTNGLLVVEMMSGRVQLGDDTFEQRAPAEIPLAGDPNAPNAPTYASFAELRDLPPQGTQHYTRFIDANGNLSVREDLNLHGLKPGHTMQVDGVERTVADPFWYFMNYDGMVYEDGKIDSDLLFPNPFYATGLPITEPVWVNVPIAGTPRDVLVQCFERRCMTWDPLNQEGWNLEVGNVGLHYYSWRYGQVTPNETVTVIETGPDTIEYRYNGNPPAETMDDGPTALAQAGDGTHWIADAARVQLAHFNASGERIGTIDLAAQGAGSVLDVDVYGGFVWAYWLNLSTNTFKVQGFDADGALVHDIDISEHAKDEPTILSSSLHGTDEGMVLMLDLGLRPVRVVGANGVGEWTEVAALKVNDHYFSIDASDDDLTSATLVIDTMHLPLQAEPGAFALESGIVAVSADRVWVKRYSVFGDGTIDYRVEQYDNTGAYQGGSSVPLADAYAYVPSPYASVGNDLFMLRTQQDELQVVHLGFTFVQPEP